MHFFIIIIIIFYLGDLLFVVPACLNIKNEKRHKIAHLWLIACTIYLASELQLLLVPTVASILFPSKLDLLWTCFITDDPTG